MIERPAPVLPLLTERTVMDAAVRMRHSLGIHRQKPRRNVGTGGRVEWELARYCEPELDLLPRETTTGNLVSERDAIRLQVLYYISQGSQFCYEFRLRHVFYLGNRRRPRRDGNELHVLVHVNSRVRIVLVGNPVISFDL